MVWLTIQRQGLSNLKKPLGVSLYDRLYPGYQIITFHYAGESDGKGTFNTRSLHPLAGGISNHFELRNDILAKKFGLLFVLTSYPKVSGRK